MSSEKHSCGQILKSSSIIGGAQGINYLIGMVRVKLVAVLICGPTPLTKNRGTGQCWIIET